jgi:hypothetical protein
MRRWYNTTYIMFAASILLLPVYRLGVTTDTNPLLMFVDMAVEILEAMDESVVARRSAELLKHHVKECLSTNSHETGAANLRTASIGHELDELAELELSTAVR